MNRWTAIATMERPRAGAGLTVLDGFVYVVGMILIMLLIGLTRKDMLPFDF